MEREDEVFLDAEEEFTPRRSGRKRRSTAGNSPAAAAVTKKPRAGKMPTERSPGVVEALGSINLRDWPRVWWPLLELQTCQT